MTYDPMNITRWTLGMCHSWIVWRDVDLMVQPDCPLSIARIESAVRRDDGHTPYCAPAEALRQMGIALQSGQLVADAIDPTTRSSVSVPKAAWVHLFFGSSGRDVGEIDGVPQFADPTVDREKFLACFPPVRDWEAPSSAGATSLPKSGWVFLGQAIRWIISRGEYKTSDEYAAGLDDAERRLFGILDEGTLPAEGYRTNQSRTYEQLPRGLWARMNRGQTNDPSFTPCDECEQRDDGGRVRAGSDEWFGVRVQATELRKAIERTPRRRNHRVATAGDIDAWIRGKLMSGTQQTYAALEAAWSQDKEAGIVTFNRPALRKRLQRILDPGKRGPKPKAKKLATAG
jgi:hypothetical protein